MYDFSGRAQLPRDTAVNARDESLSIQLSVDITVKSVSYTFYLSRRLIMKTGAY